MNRVELKTKAKQQIKGKIGILFLITLIISVISIAATAILGFIPYAGPIIATIIITPAFTLSIVTIFLKVAKDEDVSVNDAFSGFSDFWASFKLCFFVSLFTYLWTLLFIIPGIIKTFEYSMSFCILAENKEKPALECIKESREMTKGHKMELFVLSLSFIGWMILGSITFGIAYIWVMPYMYTTFANAYYSIKPIAKAEPGTEAEPTEEKTEE